MAASVPNKLITTIHDISDLKNKSITESLISKIGGIPKIIHESITDFKVKEDDYFCDLCETVVCRISVSKRVTTMCFNNHLADISHQNKSSERQKQTKDFELFLQRIFSQIHPKKDISPIIFVNFPFFRFGKESPHRCTLCEESFRFSYNNFPYCEDNLVRHLLSDKHEVKTKEFYEKCNKVKTQLEEVYGTTPTLVVDNVEFIVSTSHENNYQCKLCEENFHVRDDSSLEVFLSHLRSYDHKKKVDHHRVFVKAPQLVELFKTCKQSYQNKKRNHLGVAVKGSESDNLLETEQIPYYIVNNIEYIMYNRSGPSPTVYCSLCNKVISTIPLNCSIENDAAFKTRQNLKYHFLSRDHEKLFYGKLIDPQNKCYRRLHKAFKSFPIPVQKDLKYLGLTPPPQGGNFYCMFCKSEIITESDNKDTRNNILAHFLAGANSIEFSVHKENEKGKKMNYDQVESRIRKLFPSIPDDVRKCMEYLSVSSDEEKYLYCCICDGDKKLQLSGSEIMKHMNSNQHRSELDSIKNGYQQTATKLHEHFTLEGNFHTEVEFCQIPSFIMRNISHVSFEDTSDVLEYQYRGCFLPSSSSDDEGYRDKIAKRYEVERVKGKNLVCLVCSYYDSTPSLILIGKNEFELVDLEYLDRKQTEYNFRTHFLSQEHKFNVQRLEEEKFQVYLKLEQVFGDVPSYARNSIHQMMVSKKSSCFCTLCSNYIVMFDKSSFEDHFLIKTMYHYTTTEHQTKETETELRNSRAMSMLEMEFQPVPRTVLRDIDFLSECGANLFCVLCQETLFIEGYDLEKVRSDLCLHICSRKHTLILNGVHRSNDLIYR